MENKIVFVIPDMPGGGTERVVALLANEYAKRNIETAILLFAGNAVGENINLFHNKTSLRTEQILTQKVSENNVYYKTFIPIIFVNG